MPPIFSPSRRGVSPGRGPGTWRAARVCGMGEIRPVELPDFDGHVVGLEVAGAEWPGRERWASAGFSVHAPQRGSYQKAVNTDPRHDRRQLRGRRPRDRRRLQPDRGHGPARRGPPPKPTWRSSAAAGTSSGWSTAGRRPTRAGPRPRRSAGPATGRPYHCDGLFVPRPGRDAASLRGRLVPRVGPAQRPQPGRGPVRDEARS